MSTPEIDIRAAVEAATGPARERLRILKDRCFAVSMAVGGVAVLIAILLIFFYLFYVVVPLFASASVEQRRAFDSGVAAPRHFVLDEYAETAAIVDAAGRYTLTRMASGEVLETGSLGPADGAPVTVTARGDPAAYALFTGTADGRATVARIDHDISYPDDRRLVTPSIARPLGSEPLVVSPDGEALVLLAGQAGSDETTVAAVTESGRLYVVNVVSETSFLDDEVTYAITRQEIEKGETPVTHLLLDVDQRELYVVTADGLLSLFDIQNKDDIRLVDRTEGAPEGRAVTAAAFLSGGISVLLGDEGGYVTQVFPVRDEENDEALRHIRSFGPLDAPVRHIVPEYFRKGFVAVDANGRFGLYHTTAERELFVARDGMGDVSAAAISPRADRLLLSAPGGRTTSFDIENEHPEVSMTSLWGKVWYESRAEPEYIWQSSSASSDFEPKFSLTPLAFGTLKAAFYAMLIAMPLAILGAIYTAYFMTPRMRNIVKPSIEVMAALPTVILGFLAGLWLAPLVEARLLGILLCFPAAPVAIVLASWVYDRLPRDARRIVPDGWEALALVPVIAVSIWLSLVVGDVVEALAFGGSLASWLGTEFGIGYDQRNSLVVGMAIGFAVIPTIFSISEDAVFGVPGHLTMGSLALGATPWQTMTKIVLLTASPGIFSSVMIGMGRAVGETMIVLMATGNTPIMDFNIFEGFRALSANIAVEMPESEVASTHYRILFLAALVLFLATFVFNTMAEIVRQRLRRKYSSL